MAEIRWDDETGEMHPKLPPAIAAALQELRASTTPYSTSEWTNEAEHALRVAILRVLGRQTPNRALLVALRAWVDAWDAAPPGTSWADAKALPEWHAMLDAIGYDRDARRSTRPARDGEGRGEG